MKSQTFKRGGKREGAGRPVASTTLQTQYQRKMFLEWLAPELKEVFDVLIGKAKEGDIQAIRELFDRTYGKAAQPLWHGDNEGEKIVFVPHEILEKHGLNTVTESNSAGHTPIQSS